jgi:uncharacterized protein (DUF4415 family)
MDENKRSTENASEADGVDDFDDDIPDMSTPEWKAKFDAAPVVYGRPRLAAPKVSTTIRLDADVLEKFRATGPGWQSRINAVLKAAKP